jgi:hypothetical protein
MILAVFVLCREVVLLEVKMYWNYEVEIFLKSQPVSFIERFNSVSLLWRAHYQRFYFLHDFLVHGGPVIANQHETRQGQGGTHMVDGSAHVCNVCVGPSHYL